MLRKGFLSSSFILFLGSLDQFSKWWMGQMLHPGESIEVASFLSWTLVHNSGAAFGLWNQYGGFQILIFLGIALLVSIFSCYRIYQIKKIGPEALAWHLLFIGTLSNAWDRWNYSYVVDFINVHWYRYHWPTFNLADCYLCISICLLLLLDLGYYHD